jgi:hypothetical protein
MPQVARGREPDRVGMNALLSNEHIIPFRDLIGQQFQLNLEVHSTRPRTPSLLLEFSTVVIPTTYSLTLHGISALHSLDRLTLAVLSERWDVPHECNPSGDVYSVAKAPGLVLPI